MKRFANFESLRNGIEAGSVTKHFERFSFAILGIKPIYTGMAITPILTEMFGNLVWIFLTALGLASGCGAGRPSAGQPGLLALLAARSASGLWPSGRRQPLSQQLTATLLLCKASTSPPTCTSAAAMRAG